MIAWSVRKMHPAEPEIEPSYEEYFEDEKLPLTSVLVREAVQNSLDARLEGPNDNPVEMRFSWNQVIRDAKIRHFSGDLMESLEMCGLNYGELASPGVKCLTIEDFGTKGLIGDPTTLHPESNENDFYYFFRVMGSSQKSSRDRGSRGLGKVVFPKSSSIRSFFALTNRVTDGRTLLMGQALLKIHRNKKGERFEPFVYYCVRRDFVPLPEDDAKTIAAFKKDFRMTRSDESGLSIVIPYVDENITLHSISYALVKECYYSILDGKLVAKLSHAGYSRDINLDTIEQLAPKDDNLLKRLRFVRWAIEVAKGGIPSLAEPDHRNPKLERELFTEPQYEALQTKYKGFGKIAIRIPIFVHP